MSFNRRFPSPTYTVAVVKAREDAIPNDEPTVIVAREKFYRGSGGREWRNATRRTLAILSRGSSALLIAPGLGWSQRPRRGNSDGAELA
jgi:hypothetical protein